MDLVLDMILSLYMYTYMLYIDIYMYPLSPGYKGGLGLE